MIRRIYLKTAQVFTDIERIGNTALTQDSRGYYYAETPTTTKSIKLIDGQHIGDNTFSQWTIRGAEIVNDVNSIAWTDANNVLTYSKLTSNWDQQTSSIHYPGSAEYIQAENRTLAKIFDGDGSVGPADDIKNTIECKL